MSPKNTAFVLLSFEGPDKYSLVGGLGTRMVELSRAMSDNGFFNSFFFIGDPAMEPKVVEGTTTFYRECRNTAAMYPDGVYCGEREKIAEWNSTVPKKVVSEVVLPAARSGRLTVVMAEDWHTAESVVALDGLLRRMGLREHCVILWNINNEYGMSGVDLKRLSSVCTVTTVSEFMSKRMRSRHSITARTIPNGIPARIIGPPSDDVIDAISGCFDGLMLQKVARYDSDKNWISAIETVASLKKEGLRPRFLMRGGAQPYRSEVIRRINSLSLSYATVSLVDPSFDAMIDAFRRYSAFDIIEMDFFIEENFLMNMYGSADFVFANSAYEPFGIVGLEVMAKRGLAILGCTGEDYAEHCVNSIRTDSENPEELKDIIMSLVSDPERSEKIRDAGLNTAKSFTWDRALSILIDNVEQIAEAYNIPAAGNGCHSKGKAYLVGV